MHHHDRSDVLDGGREPQLADELGAALGVLEHGAADEQQPDDRDEQREHDAEQAERRPLERGDGELPEQRGRRRGRLEHDVDERPGDEHAADQGRRHQPSRLPDATSADPHAVSATITPNAAPTPTQAIELPGSRRRGERSHDRARHDAHEQHAAAPAGAPRIGGPSARFTGASSTWVTSASSMREWATPGTGPQAEEDGEGHDRPGHGGPTLADLERHARRRVVGAEQRGQVEDGGPGEGDRQIRLVQRVGPVDVGEVAAAADRPQRAEHVRVARRSSSIAGA